MKPAYLALAFCLALVVSALSAPDAQARHASAGCRAGAGCAGPGARRAPVRRLLAGTVRVAARVRFRPSRRFGGGCGGASY